jgi:hypothetical protein
MLSPTLGLLPSVLLFLLQLFQSVSMFQSLSISPMLRLLQALKLKLLTLCMIIWLRKIHFQVVLRKLQLQSVPQDVNVAQLVPLLRLMSHMLPPVLMLQLKLLQMIWQAQQPVPFSLV